MDILFETLITYNIVQNFKAPPVLGFNHTLHISFRLLLKFCSFCCLFFQSWIHYVGRTWTQWSIAIPEPVPNPIPTWIQLLIRPNIVKPGLFLRIRNSKFCGYITCTRTPIYSWRPGGSPASCVGPDHSLSAWIQCAQLSVSSSCSKKLNNVSAM